MKFVKSSLIARASLKSLSQASVPHHWNFSWLAEHEATTGFSKPSSPLDGILIHYSWVTPLLLHIPLPQHSTVLLFGHSGHLSIFLTLYLQKRNKPNPSLHRIPHKKIMLVKNLRTMAAMVFSLRRRNFSTFSLTTGSMSQTFIFPLWKRSKLNKSYTLGFHRFLSLKSLICCNQADCLGFKFVKLFDAIKF